MIVDYNVVDTSSGQINPETQSIVKNLLSRFNESVAARQAINNSVGNIQHLVAFGNDEISSTLAAKGLTGPEVDGRKENIKKFLAGDEVQIPIFTKFDFLFQNTLTQKGLVDMYPLQAMSGTTKNSAFTIGEFKKAKGVIQTLNLSDFDFFSNVSTLYFTTEGYPPQIIALLFEGLKNNVEQKLLLGATDTISKINKTAPSKASDKLAAFVKDFNQNKVDTMHVETHQWDLVRSVGTEKVLDFIDASATVSKNFPNKYISKLGFIVGSPKKLPTLNAINSHTNDANDPGNVGVTRIRFMLDFKKVDWLQGTPPDYQVSFQASETDSFTEIRLEGNRTANVDFHVISLSGSTSERQSQALNSQLQQAAETLTLHLPKTFFQSTNFFGTNVKDVLAQVDIWAREKLNPEPADGLKFAERRIIRMKVPLRTKVIPIVEIISDQKLPPSVQTGAEHYPNFALARYTLGCI